MNESLPTLMTLWEHIPIWCCTIIMWEKKVVFNNKFVSKQNFKKIYLFISTFEFRQKKVGLIESTSICLKACFSSNLAGNALERVQWVHEPTDLWDLTFCTRRFWPIKFQKILLCSVAELIGHKTKHNYLRNIRHYFTNSNQF